MQKTLQTLNCKKCIRIKNIWCISVKVPSYTILFVIGYFTTACCASQATASPLPLTGSNKLINDIARAKAAGLTASITLPSLLYKEQEISVRESVALDTGMKEDICMCNEMPVILIALYSRPPLLLCKRSVT